MFQAVTYVNSISELFYANQTFMLLSDHFEKTWLFFGKNRIVLKIVKKLLPPVLTNSDIRHIQISHFSLQEQPPFKQLQWIHPGIIFLH